MTQEVTQKESYRQKALANKNNLIAS